MKSYRRDSGYALVVALMLMALTAFVVREALKRVGVESTIIAASRVSSVSHATVEDALNKAVAFMRDNSHKFAYLFGKENFYNNFQREASPLYGSNDVSAAQIASNLTIVGTSDVALLSNEPDVFGYENFPASVDPTTNTGLDLIGALSEINFSGVKVRVTLIDAIPVTPAGDTLPKPTTDYTPVWRVDAMAGVDSGPHLFGILEGVPVRPVASTLRYYGMYGEYSVGNNGGFPSDMGCEAYDSSLGAHSSSNRSAKCNAGSPATSNAMGGSGPTMIYGSWGVNYNEAMSTYGKACANLTTPWWQCNGTANNCLDPGCICTTTGCVGGNAFSSYFNGSTLKSFASFCPTDQGDFKADGETRTLTTANGKCWRSLQLRKKDNIGGKIILTSNDDYYIQTLDFDARNTTAVIGENEYIRANPGSGTVRLWFWNIVNPRPNDNKDISWFRNGSSDVSQASSNDGRPTRLKMNVMVTTGFQGSGWTSNGWQWFVWVANKHPIKAFMYVPNGLLYFGQTGSSSDIFYPASYGGFYAKKLIMTGKVYYDTSGEALGLSLGTASAVGSSSSSPAADSSTIVPAAGYTGPVDLTYRLRQAIQVVR